MSTLIRSFVVSIAAAACLGACAGLEEVSPGVCGNLVVEDGEQCDGEADCGTAGAASCRFTCEPGLSQCPGALACASDGVCVASAGTFVPYEAAARYELPADRLVVGDLDGDRRDDVISVAESIRVRFGDAVMPLAASYEKPIRQPTGAAAFGELDGEPGVDVVFPTAEGVFTLLARGRTLDAVPYASAASLPDDAAGGCAGVPGWASCRRADINGDGSTDEVGFVADRDNVELRLTRTGGDPVVYVHDTLGVVTDIATGDLDGDGFGDVAYSTRAVSASSGDEVRALFGAPQPAAFTPVTIATVGDVAGLAIADLDEPADGLDDLAVERGIGAGAAVAVYLGDTSRDLSAPFRLAGERSALDVPYALVAGEFVGGAGSGVDVMAYARNPETPSQTYFWWLQGSGDAQLTVGAVDPVDATALQFLDEQWRVADLFEDPSTGNGPDEVIGLSPRAPDCDGPALTAAVPSARFTATELLRRACLEVDGDGWSPELIGVLGGEAPARSVAIAQRDGEWWFGETTDLDDATTRSVLAGTTLSLDPSCQGAQLWHQTPDAGTFVSWTCDGVTATEVVVLRNPRDGAPTVETVATLPRGAVHLVGDVNGDGLTDVIARSGREISVLLQCSTDMVGAIPGC